MMHGLDSGWGHGVSLGAAITLMLLITLLPRGLTTPDGNAISHGLLTLIMWGMSASFVMASVSSRATVWCVYCSARSWPGWEWASR